MEDASDHHATLRNWNWHPSLPLTGDVKYPSLDEQPQDLTSDDAVESRFYMFEFTRSLMGYLPRGHRMHA